MIPQRIGRYEISCELGRGSTGIVYRGIDPALGRPVAIKTLQYEKLADCANAASTVLRFRNEARAIARLQHPGVVAVYDFGEDGLRSWIAMEYVEGRNLDDILAANPLLGEERALAIMDQLLDALGCVHRHGICHRDVKPANVMVTPTEQVKLTDFGVARLRDSGLTQVSLVIGTPGCMAPEQLTGGAVDHRADLFACGVLLYRLLAGRRPFNGNPAAVMHQILHEQPVPLSEASGGGVDRRYDGWTLRALAKGADQRYSSADEMREALRAAAGLARRAPVAAMDQTVVHDTGRSHGVASVPPGLTPPAWSTEELGEFERALARQIGPLGRVILRRTVGHCTCREDLCDALARQIADTRGRQAFMDQMHHDEAARRGAADHVDVDDPSSLTDAFRTAAQQLLTRRLGPVARVLVRRAADEASGSRPAFIRLLSAELPGAQRSAFQDELTALLD